MALARGHLADEAEHLGQPPPGLQPPEALECFRDPDAGILATSQRPGSHRVGEGGPGQALGLARLLEGGVRGFCQRTRSLEVVPCELRGREELIRPAHQPEVRRLPGDNQRFLQQSTARSSSSAQTAAKPRYWSAYASPRRSPARRDSSTASAQARVARGRSPWITARVARPFKARTRPSGEVGDGVRGQGPVQPDVPFGVVAAQIPERREGTGEADGALDVLGGELPVEGRPEVGVLGLQTVEPVRLVRPPVPSHACSASST